MRAYPAIVSHHLHSRALSFSHLSLNFPYCLTCLANMEFVLIALVYEKVYFTISSSSGVQDGTRLGGILHYLLHFIIISFTCQLFLSLLHPLILSLYENKSPPAGFYIVY